MNLKNVAYFFITTISIVVTLIFGKSLLIPFVFALLLWFVMTQIRNGLDKVAFIQKRVPTWVKSVVASILLLTVLAFASGVITSNINALAKSYQKYESNLDLLVNKANEILDINLVESIKDHSGDFDFGSALSSIFNSLTDILGNAFMIVLYTRRPFFDSALIIFVIIRCASSIINSFPSSEFFLPSVMRLIM